MQSPRPLESVLVATDFSKGALNALDRVGWLPLADGARVELVHVLGRLPKELVAQEKEHARAALQKQAQLLSGRIGKRGAKRVRVGTRLLAGDPYVELVRHARAADHQLLVIGRHGRRPVRDLFMGSTAERLVRKAELPVLLVNEPPEGAYARPLVPVDLGPDSRAVVELAVTLVGEQARALHLVHAYNVPFENTLSRSWSKTVMSEYRKECKAKAEAAGKKLLRALEPSPVKLELLVRPGDPRTVIAAEQLRWRADLLVLGTHARAGLSHALLGSVAETVLRTAQCDVAVTRPGKVDFELP